MNILFVGTPEFAIPSLISLARSSHRILSVITQPDRPKGRGRTHYPPPVKEEAKKLGLDVMQPANINEDTFAQQLRSLSPDCIAVVAFGQFLSDKIIRLPKYGCINIHASLLPKYRGAAPVNWAIIQGETITGVTAMQMTTRMDAGDIIAQKTTPISPEETAGELERRLACLGAELLIETLGLIESGNATYVKQNDELATFAPKLKKEDGLIQWDMETQKVHNLIRGVTPAPGAYTYYRKSGTTEKRRFIILKTRTHYEVELRKSLQNPGELIEISPCGIHVATSDGLICITRLQPEGRRPMDFQEYIRGHKMSPGDIFVS